MGRIEGQSILLPIRVVQNRQNYYIKYYPPMQDKIAEYNQNPEIIEKKIITGPRKADRAFYDAYNGLKVTIRNALLGDLACGSVFGLLVYLTSVNEDPFQQDLTTIYTIWLLYAVFGMIFNVRMYLKSLSNPTLYVKLAQKTGRVVQEEILSMSANNIEQFTCHEIYSSETGLKTQDVDKAGKDRLRKPIETKLLTVMRSSISWVRFYDRINWFISFGIFLFNAYVFFTYEKDWIDFFTIGFMVIVGCYQHSTIVIVAAVLTIIAIVVVVVLIASFCCGIKIGGKTINVPARTANDVDVELVEGKCAICHLGISHGSNIYTLPCSHNHIFHTICLDQWLKIKSTCPSCRAEIPVKQFTAEYEKVEDIEEA